MGGASKSSPDRRGPLGRDAEASAGTTGMASSEGPIPTASRVGAAGPPSSRRTVASTLFSGQGGALVARRGGARWKQRERNSGFGIFPKPVDVYVAPAIAFLMISTAEPLSQRAL